MTNCPPPEPGDWHPEDIKAAVRKSRFGSLAGLSRAYGLPEHACQQACRQAHFWGEVAIAEALGLSPREIWPSRFRGERRRILRSPVQSIDRSGGGHRQIEAVA